MKTFKEWWLKFEPQIDPDIYVGNENEIRKAVGRCAWGAALDAKAIDVLDKSILAEDRCGREPDRVKPLAQYLAEYIREEIDSGCYYDGPWHELLEQALDAYESTENVKIRIERV